MTKNINVNPDLLKKVAEYIKLAQTHVTELNAEVKTLKDNSSNKTKTASENIKAASKDALETLKEANLVADDRVNVAMEKLSDHYTTIRMLQKAAEVVAMNNATISDLKTKLDAKVANNTLGSPSKIVESNMNDGMGDKPSDQAFLSALGLR